MKFRRRGISGRPMRINRLFIGLVILLMIGTPGAIAVNYYVNGDYGDDTNLGTTPATAFKTINKALSSVVNGDTIYVVAATNPYDEGAILSVNRPLTITGLKKDNVGPSFTAGIAGTATEAPTIRRTSGGDIVDLGAVGGITIQGINFDLTTGATRAINLNDATNAKIQYCGFICDGGDEGISIRNKVATDFSITYNKFNGNGAPSWFAIDNGGCSRVTNDVNLISHNSIDGLTTELRKGSYNIHDIAYTENTFSNKANGILLKEIAEGAGTFGDIIVAGNIFNGGGTAATDADYAFKIDNSVENNDFEDGSFSPDDVRVMYNSLAIAKGDGAQVDETVSFDVLSPSASLNAESNWWNAATGPGVAPGSVDVSPNVDYQPYLTAPITFVGTSIGPAAFANAIAGVDITLAGGTSSPILLASSEYVTPPPCTSSLTGSVATKYVDALVSEYTGGTATIRVYYDDSDILGIQESTLVPYLFDGTSWIRGSNVGVSTTGNYVDGTFLVSLLTGTPIALVGNDYTVTILPVEAPGVPRTTKPIFTTFTIESMTTDIDTVYYQIDNYSPAGWIPIQANVNAMTWNWPGWAISDAQWNSLPVGTHTYYFKFTRTGGGNAVGDNGEMRWQFFKAAVLPTMVTVTSPTTGDVLNRDPFTIMWTLGSTTNIDYITIYYSQNNGVTFPHMIARIYGTDPVLDRYVWRSPNVGVNEGRIKVVVRYNDGTEYTGISEPFKIVKGFSITSWRPGSGYTSFWSGGRQGYSFMAG